MKVLVVGANGLLGSNLVRGCLDMSWETDCVVRTRVDNLTGGDLQLINVTEIEKLEDRYDIVFHAAGNYRQQVDELIESNVGIVGRLMSKLKSAKLVFASTVMVYGNQKSIISENTILSPADNYGVVKLCTEALVRQQEKHVIVRLASLYGLGMYPNTFIPISIRNAKKDNVVTVFGNGERSNNYIHVRDAVQYLLAGAVKSANGTYLASARKSYSNNELASIICNQLPECEIRHTGEDKSFSYCYDNGKSRDLLGINQETKISEGLKELIDV